MSDATSDESPSDPIELWLPARPESLEQVHGAVARLWTRQATVGELDRMRFESAVVEIFANIVEHAFDVDTGLTDVLPDERRRRLRLSLRATDEEVTARFSDNGLPAELDLSSVTLPADDADSGRGLAMAVAALDDLHYERVDGRNHWSLVCRRRS